MPRFVFHHINKCAGTSLLSFLQNFFPADNCLLNENYVDSDGQWTTSPVDVLVRSQFIHDPAGAILWKDHVANVRTFCFLRDPLEVLVANWFMFYRWTDKEMANARSELVEMRFIAREGLHAYLTTDHPLCVLSRWNQLTRYLSFSHLEIRKKIGTPSLSDPAFGAEMLLCATRNLRSMDMIGMAHDFDNSLHALQLFMGLPPGDPQTQNVHGSSRFIKEMTRETREAAEACITLDRELFALGNALYKKQMDQYFKTYGTDLTVAVERKFHAEFGKVPDWVVISMADALQGMGWHSREINGVKFSRWIGPEPQATLYACVSKTEDRLVRFRVTNFMDPKQLENMKLMADGVSIPLSQWQWGDHNRMFEGVVPRKAMRQDHQALHLVFDCHTTHRTADPSDSRLLGVEICEVTIGPVNVYVRNSPKTGDYTTSQKKQVQKEPRKKDSKKISKPAVIVPPQPQHRKKKPVPSKKKVIDKRAEAKKRKEPKVVRLPVKKAVKKIRILAIKNRGLQRV